MGELLHLYCLHHHQCQAVTSLLHVLRQQMEWCAWVHVPPVATVQLWVQSYCFRTEGDEKKPCLFYRCWASYDFFRGTDFCPSQRKASRIMPCAARTVRGFAQVPVEKKKK